MSTLHEVPKEYLKFPNVETQMPSYGDKEAVGCDFYSKETVTIEPRKQHLFFTDVCATFSPSLGLFLQVRSSIGIKKGLTLANGLGVIESSYYANESNYGNLGICLFNNSDVPVTIEVGERIAQGFLLPVMRFENAIQSDTIRTGGFGSTNKEGK